MELTAKVACICYAAGLLVFCEATEKKGSILLLPGDFPSTVNIFSMIGRGLIDNGYDVTIMTTRDHRKLIDAQNVSHILLDPASEESKQANYNEYVRSLFKNKLSFFDFRRILHTMAQAHNSQCRELLEDENMMTKLKEKNFTLAIINGIPYARCLYIMPYKLGMKHLTLSPFHSPWESGVAALPSIEPFWPFHHYQSTPSFIERLQSLCLQLALHMASKLKPHSTLIETYVPEKPATTLDAIYRDSEMWFVNIEIVCYDYHRSSAPHYQFVAGITSTPAKPLPSELYMFVSSASHGVIVVSYGSLIKNIPSDMLLKIIAAFGKLKQRVVMRFEGAVPDNKPDNVRLEKWLPQNDLLGHSNTVLFVTHGGNNGQLEALYHGVPMLCMPFCSDQDYNCGIIQRRGYGLTVDPFDFTSDQVYDALSELLTNSSYKQAIQHCSDITRSLPSAQEKLIFYVDHIHRFGGEHLKPKHINMPLWKLFMLDVLAALLVILYIIYRLCKCCLCKMLVWCTRRRKPKND